MPSPLKQVSKHRFIDGVNTNIAREYLKSTEAAYKLNCVTMSTANGDIGVVSNIKGNTLIQTDLPEGRSKTLGWAKDEEDNKFYYFVWNSNGYHSIYMYNVLLNSITLVMQSIKDTGGIDILRWTETDLILMADIVRNNLLYWVKKGNEAAKINIQKALDNSDAGYGEVITEEFISAYKLAPVVAPVAAYFSDSSVNSNRWYGTLAKFASRFVYDDGEISNWSDWSNATVPAKEAVTGVNFIPTENNCINITVPTGSKIVDSIEISMQYTLDGGYSSWVSIANLDKRKLSIGDDSTYVFPFYNDGSYAPVDQEKIIRPYSYLPAKPELQAFTKNAMIYGNFEEGFPDVDIDMSFDNVVYEDIFLDDSVENVLNTPNINVQKLDDDYIDAQNRVTRLDGTSVYLSQVTGSNASTRARLFELTIGSDVKDRNKFNVRFQNGYDDFNFSYTALITDTALTVLNNLKQQIFASGRVLRQTPDIPAVDPYANTNSSGNYSFKFIIYATPNKQYLNATFSVNPVNTQTLKDTGQSLPNIKLGATTKYGIVYEDFSGRRSLTYTDVNLVIKTDSQNSLGGIKKVNIVLNINHTPPIWAARYQIVRTADLTYGSFIQMVIQKVINVTATNNSTGQYLDLLIGSLYTYQTIYPNSNLKYEFKKGDRIRFISNEFGTYYNFFETEILEYNDVVEFDVNENVVTDGTDKISVINSSIDNVGKFIRIDNVEREIMEATTSTEYRLNSTIGDTTEKTYLTYTLIDRRGSVRIRKPAVTITDKSLVEIFTPATSTDLASKQFFFFNKKFLIKDAGLPTRAHFGNIQEQTPSQPAKISITEGTVYVRGREMPITNNKPAQVIIKRIEDPSYSDFYFSLINSNGKSSIEYNGTGVVRFGSRLRFSNNYIEDTRINGLNDFDNLDREDYNDKYGDIKLIVFTENQLLCFKELKTGIIPVFQTIIQDNAGQDLLGTSSKLLNALRYYDFQAGIGNNPESYSANGSQHYFVSVNTGLVIRIGGDGATPISEIYDFDNEAKRVLSEAYRNGAKIFTQWDVNISALIVAIEDYDNYTFNSTFNSTDWNVLNDAVASNTPIEILTQPTNGSVSKEGNFAIVESDFLGKDSFLYRVFVNAVWVTKKVCLSYNNPPNIIKGWRPRYSDAVCETEEGIVTGKLIFVTLEEYNVDNGQATGITKPNLVSDPNYAFPITDLTACPFTGTLYYSVETTVYATKNDCSPGQTGSSVPFTIAAGAFTSVVSQASANAKALSAANAGRQANANSFGTCSSFSTFGNDLQTKSIQRNNCAGGLIGSFFLATAPANTYFASTKIEANNLAIAALNGSYGQNQANVGGTCSMPSTFTFEVVMYSNYRDVRYDSADPRPFSFEFANGGGYVNVFAAKKVSTNIARNNVVHTYTVDFPGTTINLGAIKCYLTTSSISVSGTFPSKLLLNGSDVGFDSDSVTAGIANNTMYVKIIGTAITTNLVTGSVVRLEHGTPIVIPTYGNNQITLWAKRDNCGPGLEGGPLVPLVILKDTFTSVISQMDADIKAMNYATANVQSNANTYGTCVVACTLNTTTTHVNESVVGANDGSITITATGGVGTLQFSYGNVDLPPSGWITGTSPFTFSNLQPGTYFLSTKDSNGCLSAKSVTINVGTPVIPVNIQAQNIGGSNSKITSISFDGVNTPLVFTPPVASAGMSANIAKNLSSDPINIVVNFDTLGGGYIFNYNSKVYVNGVEVDSQTVTETTGSVRSFSVKHDVINISAGDNIKIVLSTTAYNPYYFIADLVNIGSNTTTSCAVGLDTNLAFYTENYLAQLYVGDVLYVSRIFSEYEPYKSIFGSTDVVGMYYNGIRVAVVVDADGVIQEIRDCSI